MRLSLWALATLVLLGSCGGEEKQEEDSASESSKVDQELISGEQTLHTTLDNELFSVPSPVMMAVLLKDQGGEYDPALLHDAQMYGKYLTREKRALNLGVMGTDLAYASIHMKNDDAVNYMTSIDKLASELDLSSAFDKEMVDRVISNATDQDSMAVLVSEVYRRSDEYLKENGQVQTSALILIGGWVEAVHLASNAALSTNSPEIRGRVGDQLVTAGTIVRLLRKFDLPEEYDPLVDQFVTLMSTFANVETDYIFVEPETYPEKHLTVIKSQSSVKMSDELLQELTTQIGEIRTLIIQTS